MSKNSSEYMWYKDIEYGFTTPCEDEGCVDPECENITVTVVKYRAVYFTNYRPNWTSNVGNVNSSYQDDNRYYTSKLYFFEYLPITWRVLKTENSKSLLVADMILDSQDFNPTYEYRTIDGETIYSNNYEYSRIRNWLNDTFYSTAFNKVEQSYILNAYLENAKIYENNEKELYSSKNTWDHVFLLSASEVYETEYGFNDATRLYRASDYAKAQGCFVDENGYSMWTLRTPDYSDDKAVSLINSNGQLAYYRVYTTYRGVVPAIWVYNA